MTRFFSLSVLSATLLAMMPALSFAQPDRGPRTPPPPPDNSGKIMRSMTTNDIEDLLREFHYDFKRTNSPTERDVTFYDFTKNKYNTRLTLFGGKDIMIDVLFPEASLDITNSWNRRARFTRAVVYEDNQGKYITLESNFDFLGGVTLDNVRHFFKTYDTELHDFDVYLQGASVANPNPSAVAPVKDEAVYKNVSNEKLEKILSDLNIRFGKTSGKDSTIYTYSFDGQNVRLINFNGKDIMADAAFRKLTPEQVNKYNYDNKFVRVVNYRDMTGDFTALEMNLQCDGGMTDTILRNFVTYFRDNVTAFSKFAKNAN